MQNHSKNHLFECSLKSKFKCSNNNSPTCFCDKNVTINGNNVWNVICKKGDTHFCNKKMSEIVAKFISDGFVGLKLVSDNTKLDGIVISLIKYLICVFTNPLKIENILIPIIIFLWQLFNFIVHVLVFIFSNIELFEKWSIELILRFVSFIEVFLK